MLVVSDAELAMPVPALQTPMKAGLLVFLEWGFAYQWCNYLTICTAFVF